MPDTVPEIVNGVGYATRAGGGFLHPDVLRVLVEGANRAVEIDDLQGAASRLISRCTGAEAGIVTCGASAALALAAAACLAGNDTDLMDRLPDVSACPRQEIIYPRPGRYDYDHAVRLAGARLIEIDYSSPDALAQIERAIGPRTAAVGFVWVGPEERPDFSRVVRLAHAHDLPVIVDAALSLPPAENLRSFSVRGADLAAYSGGKHLGGPQGSGILCGRAPLVRSAWLQMVDMDVRPATWSLLPWIEKGWVARPPRHGIGRSMKIGKETILALLAALERYDQRDHAAELSAWRTAIEQIAAGLRGVTALRLEQLFPCPSGQPFPVLKIESGSPPAGLSVSQLIARFRQLPRKILLAEDEESPDRAYLYPMCLRPGDVDYVIESFHAVVTESSRCPLEGGITNRARNHHESRIPDHGWDRVRRDG
jgi:L-seryl-tRNA(Ser) seleniumtransferase